jgi:exonuclease VII large subunit
MSAAVDQFCNKLRDRLNAMEKRLETVKTDIKSRSEVAEKALRGKLEEARAKLRHQVARADWLRTDLKARAQEKMAETKEAIDKWKEKRETGKLKARADRAEAYASDAIEFALASVDEAEEAILDAVVARMDANSVEKPSPVH